MELTGIRYLNELAVDGRRVFVRVDFNVPIENGKVTDDTRIAEALPTIKHLRQAGAHVALASHLGRPKGRDPSESLEPCAARLAELLDDEVRFADDCIGDGVAKLIRDLPKGSVAVLENLRYHAGEGKGDEAFAKALSEPFEVYVNDAFGTCHRADASMVATVQHYKERGAGFLVQKEIEFLGTLLHSPAKPFVAVLGGAKVSDKIEVIKSLLARCDDVLIGGAMALTLLKARGVSVGKSRVEEDKLDLAREILDLAVSRKTELLLPLDHVVATHLEDPAGTVTPDAEVPDGLAAFDIGPKTRARYAELIGRAKTVFWNGPLGVFEREPFRAGTFEVARALAQSSAVTVVGGGDSAAAVRQAGVFDKISHVSTGGGASLEFLTDTPLPALEALRVGHRF